MDTSPLLPWASSEGALSYPAYRALSEQLLTKGQTTNGQNAPEILGFTDQNLRRMAALDCDLTIRLELVALLNQVKEPWQWLVLTESWCGDAAENLPVWAKLAELTPQIALNVLLRDQNGPLMDAYLTNGGRSIPKLICVAADTGREIGTWGPRPERVQQFLTDFKRQQPTAKLAELFGAVTAWYQADNTNALQEKLLIVLVHWIGKQS